MTGSDAGAGPSVLACRACGAAMEKGWIADMTMGAASGQPMKWRPGEIRIVDRGSVLVPPRPVVPADRRLPEVHAWRCGACGLLEFFAP